MGRQKLFHQHVLNSSPLKMQINSGSPTTTICSAYTGFLPLHPQIWSFEVCHHNHPS